jgi:para-nitrobenzyl esterase
MPVQVTIRGGKLRGVEQPGVCAFLGIPFAQPPVGPLRFRAPQPVAPWQGVRDAVAVGPSAPQNEGLMQDSPPWNEDCLYLNVWTPGIDNRRRPVMVWLHGGGFTIGSGGQQMYDGAALCRRGDVVVVTVNYRLGALGYAYLKELTRTGAETDANLGLRDQIAALEFVRDNIDAFGGDPGNVTLFGESAGGMSVGCLLAAPGSRGLFHRAIAQSGAAHHVIPPDEAARMGEVLLRALGLSPAEADRLWRIPVEEILQAQIHCAGETVMRGPAGRRLPQNVFTLLPVADGEVLPGDPHAAIRDGASGDVPLLLGSNADEWNFFIFLTDDRKLTLDDAALLKVCEKRVPGQGAGAVARYRETAGPGRAPEPWELFSAFESDRMFRIPAIRLAELRSACRVSTFMYLFDWKSPLFEGRMGSCHAIDVFFVFDSVESELGRVLTGGGEAARELSARVMDTWLSFARTGDPANESIGDFPPYRSDERATLVIADESRLVRAPGDGRRAFWDDLM